MMILEMCYKRQNFIQFATYPDHSESALDVKRGNTYKRMMRLTHQIHINPVSNGKSTQLLPSENLYLIHSRQ